MIYVSRVISKYLKLNQNSIKFYRGRKMKIGRRRGRVLAFQALVAWDSTKGLCDNTDELMLFKWSKHNLSEEEAATVFLFPKMLFFGTIENLEEIDRRISEHLKDWELKRLNTVDRAILRLSAYTLLFQKDTPVAVVINEAVALAKEYGTDDSFKLVNAVLDSLSEVA